jgi:predicted nucleic acid-binding protein
MSKFVLDTVVLRVFAFAHPQGIDILLQALSTAQAVFPTEVYNLDEDTLPLSSSDDSLSELARGIRYVRRQTQTRAGLRGHKFQSHLENSTQIPRHLQAGSLFISPLSIAEIPRREALIHHFGIGLGEAACLTLAERDLLTAIFLSSDDKACQTAEALSTAYLTIPDVLARWISQSTVSLEQFNELVAGMKNASFAISNKVYEKLRNQI